MSLSGYFLTARLGRLTSINGVILKLTKQVTTFQVSTALLDLPLLDADLRSEVYRLIGLMRRERNVTSLYGLILRPVDV